MLSKTFDILTPIRKQHRISRQIEDMAKFSVEPAKWVVLNDNGRVENIVRDTLPTHTSVELCIGHAVESTDPVSKYEANDAKVGRITTIAKPGTRVYVTLQDFNLGIPATMDGPKPDIIGMNVVISDHDGDRPAGTTTGTDPFDYPAFKWGIGSMQLAAIPSAGDIIVGKVTDSDEKGIEIRLSEPSIA